MVQFMRKGQLFPEQVASHGFKLSNIYLVEKSNLRLLPHCKIGATFHIRRKFHPQVTTQFCVNSTISEAYSLLLNTGTDGASKTERSRNKFFFSRTAEGHESLDTEDVGVSANEVLRFRGDKLIEQLMEVATREKVDEFIVGLPRTSDGRETEQSNKTRSFAGRLAGQAALSKGAGAQLVVPKGLAAQEQLCLGSNLLVEDNVKSYTDYDFDDDDNYEYYD